MLVLDQVNEMTAQVGTLNRAANKLGFEVALKKLSAPTPTRKTVVRKAKKKAAPKKSSITKSLGVKTKARAKKATAKKTSAKTAGNDLSFS